MNLHLKAGKAFGKGRCITVLLVAKMSKFGLPVYKVGFVVLLIFVFQNSAWGAAEKYACSNSTANSIQVWVQKGDLAFNNYKFEPALNHYKKAYQICPKNFRIICKLSKALTEYGLSRKKDKDKVHYFKRAKKLARKAIELRSQNARGYLCLSYAMGSISLKGSRQQKLNMAQKLPENAIKALELKPNLDLAWYLLGSWHRRIAALDGFERFLASIVAGELLDAASTLKAVKCLKKAIELNSDVIGYHLELGSAYEDLQSKEKAVSEYRKALDLPTNCYKEKKYQEKAWEELNELTGE